MKIDDLKWNDHPAGMGGMRAKAEFANGYTASVLKGGPFYTDGGTFEIAVMRDGHLDYTTPVTDDVLGHLSEEEANRVLGDIERLPVPAK